MKIRYELTKLAESYRRSHGESVHQSPGYKLELWTPAGFSATFHATHKRAMAAVDKARKGEDQ